MVKKIISGLAIGALTGTLIGAFAFPNTEIETVEKIVNQTVEVPVTVTEINEIVTEVKVIEYVNVTKEVFIDNGKLDEVLQHIYDNNGDIEYLTDDLDDDEVMLIADRVIFVNEMKKLAVDSINDELFDELDRETFSISGTDVTFDEDDLERLRIDDDEDEIKVSDVDFEDEDIKLTITGTFEQDDVRYNYEATVEFRDGEFDELDNIEVTEY